ncbi:hypothetical protein VTL71DRAFT_6390 [Oculimacula yallundae]|uniref:Uncharacterized protein n=1 Tax=Oculimacula yallundae TaxID=86028 RepID=A0ABR4BWT8_9HELO
MPLPLHTVKDWAPFRLDALGLVTLLGAEEISTAIGALEHSLFTECLPLFGTYMVAGNKFTRPIPGFALYNITDGVYIPIVNGWFARWLVANLKGQITTLDWEPRLDKRSIVAKEILAVMIGFITNGALITMAALQEDYYGLVNAIAMSVSVLVRLRMVHENRNHLNEFVDRYLNLITKSGRSADEEKKAEGWQTMVSIVITAPEDKKRGNDTPEKIILGYDSSSSKSFLKSDTDPEIVSVKVGAAIHTTIGAGNVIASLSGSTNSTARKPLREVTVVRSNKSVSHSLMYTVMRGVGWVFFVIHVICIGQSTLIDQILSVGLLVGSTLLTIYNFGNSHIVGNRLIIKTGISLETHKDAYLYLQPTKGEERILRRYLRLPCKPKRDGEIISQWNSDWWKDWDARFSETKN